MKRLIKTLAVLLALTMLLAGCRSREPVTIYGGDYFTVTRQGHEMCITDNQTGTEYLFTRRRVKRPQTATEAAQRAIMKTAANTETLTIKSAYNVITITVKATGEVYLFRA